VIENMLKIHDYLALIPVIEGAGGKITDSSGNMIGFDSNGSVVASANEELHSQLINIINN
jgi:inositol-phosphate phosphatase / L-galactose 1-phosphate phosphatase / histidinol-phosphatase